jgi:hypothetical protein
VYTANNPANWVDPSGLTAIAGASINHTAIAVRNTLIVGAVGLSVWCVFSLTVSGFVLAGEGQLVLDRHALPCHFRVLPFSKSDKQSKPSQKERATDAPSWVKGQGCKPGETPQQAAKRMLDEKYGEDNWKKGPGSEFSKIVKYLQRSGRC